jgi:D-galactarolactone isomerase
MNRRAFCTAVSGSTLLAVLPGCAGMRGESVQGTEQAVPYSSGSRPPKVAAPANACDCHHHIYDIRFPVSPHWKSGMPQDATVEAYRLLQKRIGTRRSVVVQPSTFGVDNRCLLDALAKFGPAARGVAVVDTSVSDAELQRLAGAGVRGIRVNFVSPQSWGVTSTDMLETLARRVNDLGWHVQILMLGDHIAANESVLQRLPTPLVVDHLGRIPQPAGVNHPGFATLRRLLDKGRTWVKLSEPYEDTKVGPPTYSDSSSLARAFVKAAPERMLWGSDWPHPTQKDKPDDALLFDLLVDSTPDESTRRRILVDNPQALYGFPDLG